MTGWTSAPNILIFSDTDAGLGAAMDSAIAAGGRVVAALPITDAIARLDVQLVVDVVMLDVSHDHGSLLDVLFDRLDGAAVGGRFSSIVTVSPRLVDIAAARISHDDVVLLVGRDQIGQRRALAGRRGRHRSQLNDASTDEEAVDLLGFSERMIGAEASAALPHNGNIPGASTSGERETAVPYLPPAKEGGFVPSAATIRGIIRARRLREQYLGAALFADPAWDMLLDLTAARLEGQSVAVSSLCIAAAVPATTALRWIKQMTDAGLFRRVADPTDGRRVFIELTDLGAELMNAYFSALRCASKGN